MCALGGHGMDSLVLPRIKGVTLAQTRYSITAYKKEDFCLSPKLSENVGGAVLIFPSSSRNSRSDAT